MAEGLADKRGVKWRIFEAASKLLAETDFDDLQVKDICKEAGVSRATFYRNFYDKYEIIQWHFNLIAESYLYRSGYEYTFVEANYLNTLEILRNKQFYCKAMQSHGYHSPVAFVRRELKRRGRDLLTGECGCKITPELEFEIDSYSYSSTHMVARWAKHGMETPPRELARWLVNTMPINLRRILEEHGKVG